MTVELQEKDRQFMHGALEEGLGRLLHGSFSERHPALGKMRTCPFCRKRRCEFAPIPCCNASHSKVVDNILPSNVRRRTHHKIHGNRLMKQVHDLSLRLQDENFRHAMQENLEGLAGFRTPFNRIGLADIPSFAERIIRQYRNEKAKVLREMQKESRRINWKK